MKAPYRHSLFWKLVSALTLFCLLLIALYAHLSQRINDYTAFLAPKHQTELQHWATKASQYLQQKNVVALNLYMQQLRQRYSIWAEVLGPDQQPLSGDNLSQHQRLRLEHIRQLHSRMGRPDTVPLVELPLQSDGYRMVLELPTHLLPSYHRERLHELLFILPLVLSLLLGVLLYRLFITPLTELRRQADTLSDGNLAARVPPPSVHRKDELGNLARTFNRMADRLENTILFQRRLLQNLSHELRTPLSRLRIVAEQQPDNNPLTQRLHYEVDGMEKLINDTLELIWLDTERPDLPTEPVDIVHLWETLKNDACFESGWSVQRIRSTLQYGECIVQANLNALAQALENILRNAIRYSPPAGVIELHGQREGDFWHLWIQDQGPGVAQQDLEAMFQPFTRLNQARPGGEGYGLGLSIARSMISLQGGELWATSPANGLRMHLRLKM